MFKLLLSTATLAACALASAANAVPQTAGPLPCTLDYLVNVDGNRPELVVRNNTGRTIPAATLDVTFSQLAPVMPKRGQVVSHFATGPNGTFEVVSFPFYFAAKASPLPHRPAPAACTAYAHWNNFRADRP
jgi:hypothetical protein